MKEADCYFEDIFIRELCRRTDLCDLSFLLCSTMKKKFNPLKIVDTLAVLFS